MKDIVGSDCNEVGTPNLSSFEFFAQRNCIPWEHTFIHSYLLLNKSKKNSMKNNEDFLIPTYLPTCLIPDFYIRMIRDLDAHIFLATSGFEKSRRKFVSFYTQ